MTIRGFFDPHLFAQTYQDRLAKMSLAVDLLPIIAIIFFGWTAVPLVALYWLENVIIGGVTLARFAGAFVANPGKNFAVFFMAPFFTVHYGMFCFVHGIFLRTFAEGGVGGEGFSTPFQLVAWALSSGQFMVVFVIAIIALNAAFYMKDFIRNGEAAQAHIFKEMFAPYGRIVTLHIAIMLGAALAFKAGQPLLGVLFLITLRVGFGIIWSMLRRRRLQQRHTLAPA